MTKSSLEIRHDHLRNYARDTLKVDSPLFRCVMNVLEDPRFPVWTGSLNGKHHCGTGGLLKHVEEVWTFAESMAAGHRYLELPKVNRQVLFTAVIFHDYGKLWDYKPSTSENGPPAEGEIQEQIDIASQTVSYWVGTAHKRLIHHISRSNTEWVTLANLEQVPPEITDQVSHAILSHHGSRAWGSPIAPSTPEAWLLHLADMASARMDECGRGVDHLTLHANK